MAVAGLRLYADYQQDESYTPSKVVVRAGTNFHDLRQVEAIEMVEPTGWVRIALPAGKGGRPLRANLIQIAILTNHQNGRDTHLRAVEVYAPPVAALPAAAT